MNEWKRVKIGDIGKVITGKTPPTSHAEYYGGPIPFITIPDMGDTPYVRDAQRTLSVEGKKCVKSCLLPTGAIMMSCIATVGKTGITTMPSVTNQQINSVITSQDVSNLFLYYVFRQLGHELLAAGGGGSVYINVSKSRFEAIEITLPSLPEQRAIAAVLSALDDKIELNRQTNKTLEEMAQAIFKEWFVDFGPFRDSGMQDSVLGKIPLGWRAGTLEQVTEILDSHRIPLSGQERILRKGSYPYYGAATIMDHIDDYIFDGIYLLVAEDGSVVDEQGGPVLQYAWGKFWVNNHAHVLRGANNFSVEQLYLLLRTTNVRPYITGAVQLKINQANLKRIPVVIPPRDVIDSFNMLISDQFAMIRTKTNEIAILSQIRDTLLPKLMSGELRVPVSDNAG